MYDASGMEIVLILGHRMEKNFHLMYYASKSLNDAQKNSTIKKTSVFILKIFMPTCWVTK